MIQAQLTRPGVVDTPEHAAQHESTRVPAVVPAPQRGVAVAPQARSPAGSAASTMAQRVQARASTPLRASPVRAAAAVTTPSVAGDAFEREANTVADRIVGGGHAATHCACGGSCGQCGGARPSHGLSLRGLGSARGLDNGARSFLEPRFNADLGRVRVHSGPKASLYASALSAKAFTMGDDIVFGARQMQPHTDSGRHLLAHEVTHTFQRGAGPAPMLQRQPAVTSEALTPARASDLSDEEIPELIRLLRSEIGQRGTDDPTRPTLDQNLIVLQTELFRRGAGVDLPAGSVGVVPRPPGLPEGGGFSLVELPDLPEEVFNALPEGQLVDSLPTMGEAESGPGSAGSLDVGTPLPLIEIAGGTGAGVLSHTAGTLATQGFAAGGPNTVGLISFPRAGTPGHFIPQNRLSWGHTAVYARIDGQIQILRSHAPTSLLSTGATDLATGGGVKAGRVGVPGSIYGQGYLPGRGIPMFTHTGARSIEFPVTRAAALAAAEGLPEIGPWDLDYTGNPAAQNLCQGQNCVRWAVPVAEEALGGRFGPLNPGGAATSVTDLGPGRAPGGAPNVSSQGRMYTWMGEAGRPGRPIIGWDNRTGQRVIATLAGEGAVAVNALPGQSTGAPTIGSMSKGMQYLRWGGRAFAVVGAVTGVAEIAMAEPGQRTRTTIEVGAGFGGGWLGGVAGGAAGGAAAGLVCGPGAPVCSTVLGVGGAIIGGIAGGLGGRSLMSWMFDSLGYDQAAYRQGVGSFMATLKDKTTGHFVIDVDGTMRWIPPDPRYSEYAAPLQRFESGESGGCQTCHDINAAWGVTAERWGSAMPEGPAFGAPTFDAMSPDELQRLFNLSGAAEAAPAGR